MTKSISTCHLFWRNRTQFYWAMYNAEIYVTQKNITNLLHRKKKNKKKLELRIQNISHQLGCFSNHANVCYVRDACFIQRNRAAQDSFHFDFSSSLSLVTGYFKIHSRHVLNQTDGFSFILIQIWDLFFNFRSESIYLLVTSFRFKWKLNGHWKFKLSKSKWSAFTL